MFLNGSMNENHQFKLSSIYFFMKVVWMSAESVVIKRGVCSIMARPTTTTNIQGCVLSNSQTGRTDPAFIETLNSDTLIQCEWNITSEHQIPKPPLKRLKNQLKKNHEIPSHECLFGVQSSIDGLGPAGLDYCEIRHLYSSSVSSLHFGFDLRLIEAWRLLLCSSLPEDVSKLVVEYVGSPR